MCVLHVAAVDAGELILTALNSVGCIASYSVGSSSSYACGVAVLWGPRISANFHELRETALFSSESKVFVLNSLFRLGI